LAGEEALMTSSNPNHSRNECGVEDVVDAGGFGEGFGQVTL